MRFILFALLALCSIASSAQNLNEQKFSNDSLIIIKSKPDKGFSNDYILFIPKKTPINKLTYLLVEPNNTGKLSDSIEVHKQHAIALASVSSVGNNIATELNIPLLVPIFPRLESKPNTYTHALDRDVILEESPDLKRLDLQLIAMIEDAKQVLKSMNIQVEAKVFMNGFSASGSFTNRFSLIHPEIIKALAIGGFNGELMFPINEIRGIKLNYPLGCNDFEKLFNHKLNLKAYQAIPQFIYMGKLDENDAVQYDDAYDEAERENINTNIGSKVQERYVACQKVYKDNGINAIFKSYDKVGHWTTSEVNLEVIMFFLKVKGKR